MSLFDDCIAAHGGMAAFESTKQLDLNLSATGLALSLKLRGDAMADRQVTVDLHQPAVTFHDLGTWRGDDPRPRRMPWRFPWTDADVLHFSGYALWNYVAAPYIWQRCTVRELSHRRLELLFPDDLPTHSPRQVAHLDGQARIARLDYTAEVFGPWARAQNVCLRHEQCGPLLIATRRRVTPRPLNKAPVLVDITMENVTCGPADRTAE
jgi:hypothetical protein